MRSMWNSLRFRTTGVLGLVTLVVLLNGGCKQEEGPADSVSQGVASGVTKLLEEAVVLADGKVDLKILYAGHPGSEREEAMVTFLREHIAEVQTCDLKGFREEQAEGFSVTVMDYDGDGFKAPRPSLSQSYSRPLMTVGVAGAFICGNLSLKMDYL